MRKLLTVILILLPVVALAENPWPYAEDAAHASGDKGNFCLAVRNDAGTALAGATGDYIPLTTDADGKLLVAASCSVGGGVEDAAETAGGNLSMAGSVRRDTQATSAGTTGDNATINTDATGNLWVTGSCLEDAAETSAGVLLRAGSVRRDTAASSADTTGDNATLNTDASGRLWTSGAVAEDAAHTSADQGVMMLGVQQTTLTGLAGTTLDYAPIQFNAQGAIYSAPTGNAALVIERIDVPSTGTAVQAASAAAKQCFVSCPGTNTSACYVRTSAGNGVTGGFAIAKGESEGPFAVQNTNLFWVDAGTNGDDVVLLCTN